VQLPKLIAMCVIAAFLSACGGGGDGGSNAAPIVTSAAPQTSGPVRISGKLTYCRVPHTADAGLDYTNVLDLPIRGVVVEAVDASGATLGSTISEDDGSYTLSIDANTEMRLQVKAQLLSDEAAKWDFQVTDNTQGDA